MAVRKEAELGDQVKDKITGFKGVVTGKFYFLYGCIRCRVEGKTKDNEPKDFCFDEPQLDILKRGVVKPRVVEKKAEFKRIHGPRSDPAPRSYQ